MGKYVIGFFGILWIASCSPVESDLSFSDQFQNLDSIPESIVFTNEVKVNNEGGHLQGVQIYFQGDKQYVYVSGSSSTYSYYGVVRMDEYPQVILVNKILEKPFKHAGGFQIFEDYLAVGIEDNEERTRSKVFLFHLGNPENPLKNPISVINREGAYERATAGAVGLTRVEDTFLMVVGDWDSRHLDFYISDDRSSQNHPIAFQKVYTIETGQITKSNWSDTQFNNYQNLNLIGTSKNELFLVGLGHDENGQNIADLFTISTKELKTFTIQKVDTKIFRSKNGANFRSAAGVYFRNNNLKLISTTDHILETSFLNIYQ